jgi:hypothetical protein
MCPQEAVAASAAPTAAPASVTQQLGDVKNLGAMQLVPIMPIMG